METNLPDQDDSEKIDKSAEPISDEDEKPFIDQLKTGSTLELPELDLIDGGLQSMKAEDAPTPPAAKSTGGLSGFIKKVTDRLLPPRIAAANPADVNPAADAPSSHPKKTSGLPTAHERINTPAPKFYPFDNSDAQAPADTAPLSRNDQRNLSTKKLQDSRRTSELTLSSTIQSVDDEIVRRIKAIRSESTNQPLIPSYVTPPFVVNDDSDSDDKFETLADKVKHGSVPPETIKLLITSTMTDEEVIAVARNLGVDWLQIPGETRDEKIQFLITYFTNRDGDNLQAFDSERSPVTSKAVFLNSENEQDWLESDNRLQALQETLNLPEAEFEKPKISFLEHLKEEFVQSSKFVKVLMVSLSVLAVVLTLTIVIFLFSGRRFPTVPVTASPTYTQFPSPRAVQFPGGWIFDLKTGYLQNDIWNPTGPEWLATTDICKLVSLPWNKQINAVYLTLEPGDEILLTMSNGDLMKYKVETTKPIKLSEMHQFYKCTSPSLIVFVIQKKSDERLVLIAIPSNTLLDPLVTVTAMPAPSSLQPSSTP